MSEFPVEQVRRQFPALNHGTPSIFFDNAAGAQIPHQVLDAVNQHLLTRNVQRGGPYRESREVDAILARARQSVATFLDASDASEVSFGLNATSFIRLVSLAIGHSLAHRREIVVTDLDHEANVSTWLALEREGAVIRWWRVREDGSLHVEDLEPLLSSRTRLVACTVASNATGTRVDAAAVGRRAHAAGAEVFLDCVQYAPHAPVDVQAWDCDYLVCSGYKIFAPHMGFLWGRKQALQALPTFREDFIPDEPPTKIEVGTYTYENVAGMDAAVQYLATLAPSGASLRERLVCAMERIQEYEAVLSRELLHGIAAIPGAAIYGVRDLDALNGRVPTVCFRLKNLPSATVAARLGDTGIAVRDGHMYSPRLMRRLGVDPEQGLVRASLVHYNTVDEVHRFLSALQKIAHG